MKSSSIKFALSLTFLISGAIIELVAQDIDYKLEEKVSLLTDKELYIAGEKIFFHVTTYEAFWGKPIEFSRIAYVELYSQRKEAFVQVKAQLVNSKGNGFLLIPRDIPSGIYYLRAYTNFMKNDGYSSFFTKKIKVVNPFVEPEKKEVSYRSSELICNFYPEGGNLVAGYENKLICRFVDEKGTPQIVKARLVNDVDSLIQSASSESNGIVSFNFNVESERKYRVQAVSFYGTMEEELPIAGPDQLSLIEKSSDEKYLILHVRNSNQNLQGYQLVLRKGKNSMVFSQNILLNDGMLKLSREDLLPGFQYIQIQNSNGETISSLGINNKSTIEAGKIELDKVQYSPRGMAKLSIENVVSINNILVAANRVGENTETKSQTFNSELISDYSVSGIGYEEIISNNNLAKFDSYLSALQKQNSSSSSLTYLPELDGDIISGRAQDRDGNPIVGEEVIQSFNDSINNVQSYTTDTLGRFFFHVFQEKSNSDLILRISEKASGAELNIDWEFYPEYNTGIWEEFSLNDSEKELVKEAMVQLQVTDAYSEYFKTSDEETNKGLKTKFYGEPTAIFYLDDYIALPNIEEFLFEIVTWAVPFRKDGEKYIRIVSPQSNNFIGNTPLFLIDGIPFFNSDAVFNLNPEEVKSIAVFNEKYFYKDQIFDGILEIETKSGKAGNVKLPRNTYRYTFVPVQVSEQKFSIKLPTETDSSIPVMGNTIYWNPEVSFENNQTQTLEFMLPDNYGKYQVKCFYIDKGGNYTVGTKDFQVVP